jgi:hypothetical protein
MDRAMRCASVNKALPVSSDVMRVGEGLDVRCGRGLTSGTGRRS